MCTAASLTIAEKWKQPKCPSTDAWLRKCGVYTHTHTHTHMGILFSHKKEKILSSAATWMDMRGITLSKVSQIKTK